MVPRTESARHLRLIEGMVRIVGQTPQDGVSDGKKDKKSKHQRIELPPRNASEPHHDNNDTENHECSREILREDETADNARGNENRGNGMTVCPILTLRRAENERHKGHKGPLGKLAGLEGDTDKGDGKPARTAIDVGTSKEGPHKEYDGGRIP